MPERAPNGKVFVYEPETGQRHERWPVDARELVEVCGWTYADPSQAEAAEAAPPKEAASEVPAAIKQIIGTGVRDLRGVVENISDVGILQQAQKADERTTATPIYQARIDQLIQVHPTGAPMNATTEAGPGAAVVVPAAGEA